MAYSPSDLEKELSPEDRRAFMALIEGSAGPPIGLPPMEVTGRPEVDPLAMQRKRSMLANPSLAPDELTQGSVWNPATARADQGNANMEAGPTGKIMEEFAKKVGPLAVDPWLRKHDAIAQPEQRTMLPEQDPSGFQVPKEWAEQRARQKEVSPTAPLMEQGPAEGTPAEEGAESPEQEASETADHEKLYAGATTPGNIDLSKPRPPLKNPDGTTSTVSSISYSKTPGGPEILIPTVVDGKRLTDDEAIAHAEKTGQNLGTYPTVEAANAAGERIHQAQAAMNPPAPAPSPRPTPTGPQGAAAPSPMLQQPASTDDVMTRFAQAHAANTEAPYPHASVPEAKEPFSTGGLGLAALADLVLNRGRSIPTIVALGAQNHDTAWETQQRQMLADKNAAEIEHLRKAGVQDPMTLMLRQQNYDLQKQRLEMQQGAEGRKTRAQQIKEDRARPESPQSEAARQIAIKNGVPPDQVKDQSWDDIHSLYPSINKNLESTGAIGRADVSHAAQKAGAEAAATEGSRIRVAEAGAGARAQAQGDVQRDLRAEQLELTRGGGEAEADSAHDTIKNVLHNRTIVSQLGSNLPQALGSRLLAPDKATFDVARQAYIDAVTKNLTGSSPHETEIRAQLGNLPNYDTPGAEVSFDRAHAAIKKLAAAGNEAIQKVKREAPTVRDRPKAPVQAPKGTVRIRDPKTGRTGNFKGTAQQAHDQGFEVIH